MAESSTQPKNGSGAIIEARGLSKHYASGGKNVDVLKNVSLSVPAQTLSVVIGRSGSGKSTLLSLIAGLETADHGTVTVSGKQLSALPPEELAQFRLHSLGLVFQFFNLLPTLSLEDNVLLPAHLAGASKRAAKERAHHLLDRVGILPLAQQLPSQVSGGEIQRAAIARALINSPALVLADEPTGNLDEQTGTEVLELFLELAREEAVSLLIVTHDEKLITGADHCFLLEHGSIQGESGR